MSQTIELVNVGHAANDFTSEGVKPAPYLRRKQWAIRAVGVLLGVPLTPVILVLMAAVRLTSAGPALYRQQRVGLFGREFTIFKLRSMYQDAEAVSGPTWASDNDPRVTALGKFLRWSHLDELPQIFNVIRGEMDFVGPRPERPEIIDGLVSQIPHYLARHEAMPGITGIAQVNLRPDQNIECVRKKIAADRFYIETANLWLDARLIAATLLRLVGVRYHLGAKLLGVTVPDYVFNSDQHAADSDSTAELTDLLNSTADDQGDTQVFAALQDTVVDGLPPRSAAHAPHTSCSQHRSPR